MVLEKLAQRFEAETFDNIYQAKKLKYHPNYWQQMVMDVGAVEATRRIIHNQGPSSGMTQLYLLARLDLSAEALMLKPEYAPLFTAAELQLAREILQAYHYTAPWDESTTP